MSMTSVARLGALALLAQDVVGRVVVAQVVGRDRAQRPDELDSGKSTAAGQLLAAGLEQLRQAVDAVDPDRPDPGQVVEPDVLELDPLGLDAEVARRTARWNPIATLHSPIARCPASSSAWVTIPTGFVKSTIQAPGARRAARPPRRARGRRGTVRSALANPPGAGRLLADRGRTSAAASRRRAGPPGRRPAAG